MEVIIIGFLLIGISLGLMFYSYRRFYVIRQKLLTHEKEMSRRMYEIAILKQLGERIGYSLKIQEIVDIIAGSLHQFVEYSSVSYMILEPENILFNVHLEQSVTQGFIEDVKKRMLNSLSALLDRDFSKDTLKEVITGAILIEDVDTPIQSFFNIPLAIGDKVVGVLTVAHTQAGLYKDEEMTILYKITQQASQAVSKLQDVVKTEEQKLNAMVASMTEGVIMTDKDLVIQVVNPIIKKALNISEDSEIRIFDVIQALEGKLELRSMLEESIKLNKIVTYPEILLSDKAYQVYISPVKVLVTGSHEEVIGAVVLFHDITHDKELEQLRDEFTSMMVHELRSPLDNIKRISEVLEKKEMVKDEAEEKDFLRLIYHNSSDMLELVNDLLDVAKLESGKFEIHPSDSDIRKVINDRIEFYQSLAQTEAITFTTNYANNVPPAILLDPHRISQVVDNYISNSIKYSPKSGQVRIDVVAYTSGQNLAELMETNNIQWFINPQNNPFKNCAQSVIVAITDHGTGIDTKNISELFNKFKQLESRVEIKGKKGTGLGLAIVKGIIESHGGIAGVVSVVGSGSTFYFTIPIRSE